MIERRADRGGHHRAHINPTDQYHSNKKAVITKMLSITALLMNPTSFISIILLALVWTACGQEKTETATPAETQAAAETVSYTETYRPQYHFSPAINWMNDPNGMVYYEGEYHLFYQYNPFGDTWGHMSWGHVVSTDLVHWEHLPVALLEEDGVMIFSGSAVVDWNNTSGFGTADAPPLVAIYTGHYPANEHQEQHIAFSTDRGRTWTRYDGNPVLDRYDKDFRDPKVIWHEPTAQWVMVVARSAEHTIQFYGSPNLKDWTFLSEFGPVGSVEGLWECPDLFELPVNGDSTRTRWVLQVDVGSGAVAGGSGAQYFMGDFDGATFRPDDTNTRWVDYGKDFYAAVSWSDVPAADGRRLWLGWLNNWQYAQEIPTGPWRGAQSIPREVVLREDDQGVYMAQIPVEELNVLRGEQYQAKALPIKAGTAPLTDTGLDGRALEIIAEFEPGQASEFGLKVRVGPDEETVVGYDVASETVFVDRQRSGAVDFHKDFPGKQTAPLSPEDGRVRLHLFVDWSSIEVFAGHGRVVITDRIFPSPESDGLALYATGGPARLLSLDMWEMGSVWD